MKFKFVCVVLILLASVTFVTPVQSDELSDFSLVKAYWGTDQPVEVSPGDVEILTVILRYESSYSFSNLIANLSLSEGFETVGGGDKASVIYTGYVSRGSIITLEFPIFITLDVEKGNYTADLDLEYFVSWGVVPKDRMVVPLEVTGKPEIKMEELNGGLYEGKQQVSISVSNEGDAAANNLEITDVYSSGISAELEVGVELMVDTFLGELDPGDNVTIPLSIDVPSGSEGMILPLTIEASYLGPRNGYYLFSETLRLSVTEVDEVEITTKFPDVTVEAGNVVQFPITISNSGADRLLTLSVEPPADWKVVFKSENLEVSRLYMESGSVEYLVIEVTPPSTAAIDSYVIPVQVNSEMGDIYAETMLKATIVGSYVLNLWPSTLLTSSSSGGSTTFTAEVTNIGYSSVTGVGLDIEVPEDWEFSINPVQLESLTTQESFTFNVFVGTPEDTVAGDYLITLSGASDQVESDQVQVRVTVTTPTEWGLYGVGIAVLFIVALVLVFMKFKRR